jgi:hypothetical protein
MKPRSSWTDDLANDDPLRHDGLSIDDRGIVDPDDGGRVPYDDAVFATGARRADANEDQQTGTTNQ